MSSWEAPGKTDEWMTPRYVFDALGVEFDLDVAAPVYGAPHVPSKKWFHRDALEREWGGFVWMNPPYGGRNALMPWVEKFLQHGNGLALVPDRTSAPWFAPLFDRSDAIMFVYSKIKFERPDGSLGMSPGNGTALAAVGQRGVQALLRAHGVLGSAVRPIGGLFHG